MTDVQITGIRKSYGHVVALEDISISIPSGAFFTLLGPSGCGKTTLLRTIAGFHRQDSGNITVAGQMLDQVPVHQRDIGMVFQDYAIFPHLSVRRNIEFGLRQRKVSGVDRKTRVAEILDVVQLSHLAERMPHELSGGQQQRVGLARALVTRPKVLLMDEPLSNLDAQLRIDLRAELRAIQQELGITTIYVTHDQEEALEMSDFVCVMYQGVIQQMDTPWVVYQQPANRFVASFVGNNNFLAVSQRAGNARIGGAELDAGLIGLSKLNVIEAVASIRPEHVRLIAADPSTTTAHDWLELPATFRRMSFAGRELRMTAEVADGTLVHFISEPQPEFFELRHGTPVHLRIQHKHIQCYRADESGSRL